MSDGKPLNDWVKDWEALQRQYLAAWSDLMQKSPTAAPPPPFSVPFGNIPGMFGGAQAAPSGTPPWHEGLEQWARLFGNKGAQSETVDRLVESGKAYIEMIKGMLGGGVPTSTSFSSPGQAWFDAMRGAANPPSGFSMPGMDVANNPFLKAMHDITGKGAHGLGELPAAFAPFLEQFRHENMSWLRMPAFGLAREHQEHYQRTAVAFVEYQDALRAYNLLLLKASQRGLEMLEGKLAERSEPGRAIESPRALYDLWVDAAEDAYAEIALSDEFTKAYGELANAQMRMRSQIQAEVERIGTDLGMPTRTELNSVHQRLHDLRRQFRDEKDGSSAIGDLEAQISELRAEVARLKAQATRAPAKSSAATKPASSASATSNPPLGSASTNQAARAEAPKFRAKARRAARRKVARRTSARVKAAKSPGAKTAAMKPTIAKPTAAAKTAAAPKTATTKRVVAKPAAAARPRPVTLVNPAPAAKAASAAKTPPPTSIASFGDAIAAMRRRVAKRGPVKSAAARVVVPEKAGKASRKSRKRNKDKR